MFEDIVGWSVQNTAPHPRVGIVSRVAVGNSSFPRERRNVEDLLRTSTTVAFKLGGSTFPRFFFPQSGGAPFLSPARRGGRILVAP